MLGYGKRKGLFAKKYMFLLIGAPVVFWAFAFPFIKIGLEELSSVNLTIMRLLVVCIIFIFLLLIMPNKFSKLHKKDIIPIFLLGFLGIIVYHLGLNYGEQYISASAASLIIATIPIFVVILAVIFLREKITLTIVSGIVLSSIGIMIISISNWPEPSLEISYLLGSFAVLLAALMGALYIVAGKKLLSRYPPISLTTYAFLLGSLGLIPFASQSLFEEVATMSNTGWIAVLFLALCPTVISYLLWYMALEIKNASELSVYLYFIPVISTMISSIILHEQITLLFIIGGTLVILALYIVNKKDIEVNEVT